MTAGRHRYARRKEYKLAGSYANPISVSKGRAAYLNSVDECPVVTFEVGNLINIRGNLGDGAVISRDRGVANHDLVGTVAAQRQRTRQ